MSARSATDWSAARRSDGAIELWFSDGSGRALVTLRRDQARAMGAAVVALAGDEPRSDSQPAEAP